MGNALAATIQWRAASAAKPSIGGSVLSDERSAAQIKRLTDLAHANGLIVSVAPFGDRGPVVVIDDPLDASGATVRMPASMALALLELVEAEVVPGSQETDEFRQFERECLMDLDRIIEATR
jgi:hypothetical protein